MGIFNKLRQTLTRMPTGKEARIQLMFDAAPLLIHYWNKDFEIIDCNQSAANFHGLPSKGNISQHFRNALPMFQPDGKDTKKTLNKVLTKVFNQGYATYEFMLQNPAGDPVHLDVVAKRMTYEHEEIVVTYAKDITEMKSILVNMQEAEERMHLMLDGSPIACYLINSSLKSIDCNKAATALFGFSSKEESIRTFNEIAKAQKNFRNQIDLAIQLGGHRFEWNLPKINGQPIPCDITLLRFRLQGKYVVAAYIYDLRSVKEMAKGRERLREAEENNRAKNKFLAKVSHEIRTPITAVLGISEIELQNPTLSARVEESFAKIHDSATILLDIVNDILDLSKMEAGKMDVFSEAYEVSTLVDSVSHLHIMHLGGKDINFKISIDENLSAVLIGDALRIKQIISNLLSNAFKYTDFGSVILALSHEKTDDTTYLIISVRDSGRGLSKEQIETLYDDYTRFHEQQGEMGTGLGMSIVYSLAVLMNATIDIDSELGMGTSITVRIPQKTAGTEKIGKKAAVALENLDSRTKGSKKKFNFVPEPMPYGSVLVVDDIEANLYVARGLLSFYDLNIETCDSGHKAIEKIKSGKVYDIIFMDHMMPGIDGIETMQILRDLGYTEAIIALTANALIGQAEEFIKSGFNGFISKPINTGHLNSILIKHIKNKQTQDVIDAANKMKIRKSTGNINDYLERSDVFDKLRYDFVKNQKDATDEIKQAIMHEDFKTAHRIAHSLRGLAALIGEHTIVKTAEGIERSLKNLKPPDARQLDELQKELSEIIAKIEPELEEIIEEPQQILDEEKAKAVFDELEPLLKTRNADSLRLVDDLKTIPSTALLVQQVVDFDFGMALDTLLKVRDELIV